MSLFSEISLMTLLTVSAISIGDRFGDLNIWIDRQQIISIMNMMSRYRQNSSLNLMRCPKPQNKNKRFLSIIPKEVYVISKGTLPDTSVSNAKLSHHYPIPALVDVIHANWKSGKHEISYTVQVTIQNYTLMHEPILNISPTGFVSSETSSLKMTLPCTGRATGIVEINIAFWFRYNNNNFDDVKSFSVKIFKQCLETSERSKLNTKCRCKRSCIKKSKTNKSLKRKICILKCRQKRQ